MSTAIQNPQGAAAEPRRSFSHVAVGIDGFDEGHDAAALGSALATATGAEVLLAAVVLDPLVVLPEELNLSALRKEAEKATRDVRDEFAPGARVVVESDLFVARGLERIVRREHRDLLVVGSSRHGHENEVMIGRCTRQLLHDAAMRARRRSARLSQPDARDQAHRRRLRRRPGGGRGARARRGHRCRGRR